MPEAPRLAARVRAANTQRPYKDVLPWLREQLGDEASDLDELLADRSVTPAHIWHELTALGYQVSSRAVTEWCAKARR